MFSVLAAPHGVQSFPHQGSNLRPLKWNLRVVTPGLPAKSLKLFFIDRLDIQGLPGGPKTLCSQCEESRSHPWSGNWIPHAATESSHAAAEDPACRDRDPAQPNKINKYCKINK